MYRAPQLLEGARLPPLHTSKHFLNLTNGLEMAPLLHQLQLPYRWAQAVAYAAETAEAPATAEL
jgi:hypothetical protein